MKPYLISISKESILSPEIQSNDTTTFIHSRDKLSPPYTQYNRANKYKVTGNMIVT